MKMLFRHKCCLHVSPSEGDNVRYATHSKKLSKSPVLQNYGLHHRVILPDRHGERLEMQIFSSVTQHVRLFESKNLLQEGWEKTNN